MAQNRRKENVRQMIVKFTLDEGAYKPEKAHASDAGYDLRSREDQRITDCCGGRVFDTGVHVEIPEGYVGYVQGRSGLNIKMGIICPTGTIDAGYTGSIKVKLYNMDINDYEVQPGDKIAQLVIQPLADTELVEVIQLGESERGESGFGSTGR